MIVSADTAAGEDAIRSFLSADAPANTFMLGNLETYGLAHPEHQQTLVALQGGQPVSVLMRHHSNALFYAAGGSGEDGGDDADLAARVRAWHETGRINRMNGLSRCVDRLVPYLGDIDLIKPMTLAVCAALAGEAPGVPPGYELMVARGEDPAADLRILDEVLARKAAIPEFIILPGAREGIIEAHRRRRARTLAFYRGGELVASAATAAENPRTAMIVGVFTVQGYRGRGLASALTALLTAELLAEGRLPVLFYENPVAARVYRRMGYAPRDEYSLLYFET
jgi:predicted GNAT family acetyltransferase